MKKKKARNRGTCPYCGVRMQAHYVPAGVGFAPGRVFPTVDHFYPKGRCRNPDVYHNKVIVCRQCNGDKGGMLPQDWLAVLRRRNDPRADKFAAVLEEKLFVGVHGQVEITNGVSNEEFGGRAA